ncbi:tyrosine-type recombinase/integrase [Chloroflexota bacterium]
MASTITTQLGIYTSVIDDSLLNWAESFLNDRKARGSADGTIVYYRNKLKLLFDYCDCIAIDRISQITPAAIRQYLLHLKDTNHNPGGVHAAYRTLRTFLYWYEDEAEPEGWSNPIRKVKAPKVPIQPIEPVSHQTVARMVKVCQRGTFTGDRDIAILLSLLDSGARITEFLNINLEDINQVSGDILIRKGKGSKPREVYLGKQSRRALRRYLKHRKDKNSALWVTHPRFGSERLKYDGVKSMLVRRARRVEIEPPTPHDFRRAFALTMLRNGTDLYTLAKLMGHEGIVVLQRYLKQTYQDTQVAHRHSGPVDNSEVLWL